MAPESVRDGWPGLVSVRKPSEGFAVEGVAPSPAIASVHPISENFSGTLPASQALLTVREVAERLRVCTATVYRLIERRTLPALRVAGTFLRVRSIDLARLMMLTTENKPP